MDSDNKHFLKRFTEQKSRRFGTPYDYDSLTHRNAYAMSETGDPTIVTKVSVCAVSHTYDS